MSKALIEPVKDNQDKENTYRTNLSRYNRAMKEGFYFEAMLIDYAMMEDRLRSFLYHIGLISRRNVHKADVRNVKKSLRKVIQNYKHFDEKDDFSIRSISDKIRIIRCTLKWAEEELENCNDRYLLTLRKQYDRFLDTERLMKTLDEIDTWRNYRNEIIHALLNKNTESVDKDIKSQAEEGMRLCRELDSQVKCLKKGNWIRRSMKLPNA